MLIAQDMMKSSGSLGAACFITEVALLIYIDASFWLPVFALLLPANGFGQHAHCCHQHCERFTRLLQSRYIKINIFL